MISWNISEEEVLFQSGTLFELTLEGPCSLKAYGICFTRRPQVALIV